jgi:hypothetical protein
MVAAAETAHFSILVMVQFGDLGEMVAAAVTHWEELLKILPRGCGS